jgi:peptide/nickel transport system permease protein
MRTYLLRRAAVAATLFFAITAVAFWVLAAHLNPLYELLFQNPRPTERIDALTAAAHLHESLPARYWLWLKGIVAGGPGARTILDHTPIWHPVLSAFVRTLELAAASLLVAVALALVTGVTAAANRARPADRLLRFVGYLTWSLPAFVTALVLQGAGIRLQQHTGFHAFVPGGPPTGAGAAYVVSWFRHMTLPVVATSLGYFGLYTRYVRSAMLVTLAAPYTTVARGKGVSERRVRFHHALRNALIPLVAVVTLDLGAIVGTTIVADVVFGLQGLGGLFLASIRVADPNQLEAILAAAVAAVIALSLLGDAVLGRLDPRIAID